VNFSPSHGFAPCYVLGALKLLQSFKTVKREGTINRQMMEKFNDILSQVDLIL
jgi:hypothetical protein